jgi:hypothetical protein
MRHHWSAVCFAVALAAVASYFDAPVGAQCGICVPEQQFVVSGPITYKFSGVDGTLQTKFNAAATEWTDAFRAAESNVRLTYSTTGLIDIYLDDTVCPAWGEARNTNAGHYIRICSASLNYPSFLERLVRHEFGHIVGFASGGCSKADSVMTDTQPSEMEGAATHVGCADAKAVLQKYEPPPPPVCSENGVACFDDSDCCENNCNIQCQPVSPILVDVKSNTAIYQLTSAKDGVAFDLNVDGTPERIGWTEPESLIGLLTWDRNQNGTIDDGSELFGNMTPKRDGARARNGFEALLDWDGGVSVSDGKVDSQDWLYAELRLWFDRNHNGISESNELITLSDAGVVALFTSFRETPRVDRYGNRYWLEGTVLIQRNGTAHSGRVFDVIFATETTATKGHASPRGR